VLKQSKQTATSPETNLQHARSNVLLRGRANLLGAAVADDELQQALTMREIVRAYGTAIHVAATLQPPPSPVRLHAGIVDGQALRRSSLLNQPAVRFIAWFG